MLSVVSEKNRISSFHKFMTVYRYNQLSHFEQGYLSNIYHFFFQTLHTCTEEAHAVNPCAKLCKSKSKTQNDREVKRLSSYQTRLLLSLNNSVLITNLFNT